MPRLTKGARGSIAVEQSYLGDLPGLASPPAVQTG